MCRLCQHVKLGRHFMNTHSGLAFPLILILPSHLRDSNGSFRAVHSWAYILAFFLVHVFLLLSYGM